MSLNLLESVKSELSSALIDKVSNYVNESRGNTSNALTGLVPLVLAYFSDKAKTTQGAESIIGAATGSKLTDLLKGEDSYLNSFEHNKHALLGQGNALIGDLFKGNENSIFNSLADYANISKEASSGIMASVLPLIMGTIGKKITAGGIDASALSGLFDTEKESIFSSIPTGLASLGGVLGISGLAKGMANTTQKTVESVNKVKSSTMSAAANTTKEVKKGGNNWLLPLLALIAAGLLGYFLLKGCNKNTGDATTVEEQALPDANVYGLNGEQVVDSLGNVVLSSTDIPVVLNDSINGMVLNADNYVVKQDNNNEFIMDKDGKAIKVDSAMKVVGGERTLGNIELPNGVQLQAFPGGIEEQLVNFIQSDDYKDATDETLKEKWFDFDDLNFEFGTTTLTPESKRQLNNIVAILKAFPHVKMKLGAYTDKKGDAAANLKLSQNRANAVKAALDQAGVGAQIVSAEGYGEQFAKVAENASDKEREADRKTAVRLSK